jgi:hypothetical protein
VARRVVHADTDADTVDVVDDDWLRRLGAFDVVSDWRRERWTVPADHLDGVLL